MLTSTISTLCYLDDWWTTHIVSLYLSQILNRNCFTSECKDSQNIRLIDIKEILDFCTCSHFVTQRIKCPLCKNYSRWMRNFKKAIILSKFCSKGYWCLKRKKKEIKYQCLVMLISKEMNSYEPEFFFFSYMT